MDEGLLKDIIEKFEQLPPEDMQRFLQMLKFRSDELRGRIAGLIHNWAMFYTLKSRKPCYTNAITDPPEIIEAFKKHFAKQLEAVTQ